MNLLLRCILILTIILTGFAAAYAQAGEAETKKGTASISGQITSGGKPVRGIVVTALGVKNTQQMMQYMMGQMQMPRARTDAEGNYTLNGLEAGKYEINVQASAMVVKQNPKDAKGSRRNRSVIIGDGESIENINFSVTRGGVITGQVTKLDGSPAIGEEVSVKLQQKEKKAESLDDEEDTEISVSAMLYGALSILHGFTSDDRGIYRIYGLPDGKYKVIAGAAEGKLMTSLQTKRQTKETFYPGVATEAAAGVVEISGGNEVGGIDIKLGGAANAYSIKGRILDETGKPVSKMVVNYVAKNLEIGIPFVFGESKNSNNQGEFIIENLLPGTYKLSIESATETTFYADVKDVEIKDANVSGIEIHLNKDVPVRGQVIIDHATAAGDLRVEEIQLYATSSIDNGHSHLDQAETSSTANITPDGQFLFRGLRPGKVRIGMRSRGRAADYDILSIERNALHKIVAFEIQSGETVNDVVVVIAKKNCKIRGQIKIEGGTLPKGSTYELLVERLGNNERVYSSRVSGDLQSEDGADNRFVVESLLHGQYILMLRAEGYSNSKNITYSTTAEVSLTSSQELDVVITLDLSAKNKDR